jgi:hypothetical protein
MAWTKGREGPKKKSQNFAGGYVGKLYSLSTYWRKIFNRSYALFSITKLCIEIAIKGHREVDKSSCSRFCNNGNKYSHIPPSPPLVTSKKPLWAKGTQIDHEGNFTTMDLRRLECGKWRVMKRRQVSNRFGVDSGVGCLLCAAKGPGHPTNH